MKYIPGFSKYLEASVPRYARGGEVMDDMAFGDYGLGGPMLSSETVGFDLANPLLGGPEQGGLYTGGMGGGPSRTEAERQQAILDVNPYVAPSQGVNLDPITSLRSGGQTGYYFANELGLPARYGDSGTPGFVPVDPNATYRLVKGGAGGDVVYSGAGGEGLRSVFEQANKLTLDDPKNAYWGVEVLDPATGQYKRVAENQGPNGLGIVGDIAGVALPIAAAIATGGASLGVQIAAGAAAGGLGGFLAGKDPLTSALIAGATAGLGNVTGFNNAVGGALSNAGDAVKNALLPEIAKQAATEAGGDIVVNALSNLAKGTASGLLQGAASGLTGGTSPTLTQQPTAQTPSDAPVDDTIVVSATPSVAGSGLPFGAAVPVPIDAILSGSLTAAQPLPKQQPTTDEPVDDEILVEARKSFLPPETLAAIPAVGGLLAATGGGAPNVINGIDQATGEIVVEAPPSVAAPPPLVGIETAVPSIAGGALTAAQTSSAPKKDLGLDDIADYLRLAGLASGLVGGLTGGKGGSDFRVPAGAGALSSVFNKELPASTLPNTGELAGPRSPEQLGQGGLRDMRDYYRYGYGPEQSFFNYVPQGAANTSQAYTGYEEEPTGFAQGGFAVEGAGDGRDDKIPALLSDGEYVIDAETVALLGNGSNKAGAELLDSFRVNVRKQKGKKLARGEFSDNAKRPEHYMAGGHA